LKLVDVKTMRALEEAAIQSYGIPSVLLMENAAAGFVRALKNETGALLRKKVHVFCGGGNNGGDGFAIARMAHNQGAEVVITALCDPSLLKGDAKTNFDIVQKMGISHAEAAACAGADIIVDAIFGTGFHGETDGAVKDAITYINESKAYVASVDIPSGVCADTGLSAEHAVFCDLCVTFLAAKPGHLLFPGRSHFKTLIKTDISVPRAVINQLKSGYDVIDKHVLVKLPVREENSHKGSFGKALAFVGSYGMSGAAVLSASAILKSGAGISCAAVPESVLASVTAKTAALMTCPLPCKNNVLSKNAEEILFDKLSAYDVLLAGCGIGQEKVAKHIVFRLLKENEKPMVLDADALNLLALSPTLLEKKKCDLILTPHIKEFSRLLGISTEEIAKDRLKIAKAFSEKYKVTLVLKDAVTVVATPEGALYVSTVQNSGMATAGSGDVLAGIITGLLAQGASCEDAAVLGVYLHQLAGAIAKEACGEYGMTAEDILSSLPAAIKNKPDITPYIKEL